MPYRVVRGEFHIHYPPQPRTGPEPDGDTVKFLPQRPSEITDLRRRDDREPDFSRGMINIRFEGIDALETHFKECHQDLLYANEARDKLLQMLGFKTVEFFEDLPNKVELAQPHPVAGHVLIRVPKPTATAGPFDGNGRLLGLVYAGRPKTTAAEVYVNSALLNRSANARLLAAGLAYPEFYTTLPVDLTARMRTIAKNARQSRTRLWSSEDVSTTKGRAINGIPALEKLVLWPKIFRRLVSYFSEGHAGLARFTAWLREDPRDRDDRLLLTDTGELGNMHDLVEVDANKRLKFLYHPENVVILPDNA